MNIDDKKMQNQNNNRKEVDDYDWNNYTPIYENQMHDPNRPRNVSKGGELATEFEEKNGELVFYDNLHDNWKEIYHQVHQLKVKTAFECGCGPGLHLRNIKKITQT